MLYIAFLSVILLLCVQFLARYLTSAKSFISATELRSIVIIFMIILIVLFITLFAITMATLWLTLKSVLKPLDDLKKIASEIKHGNLDCHIEYEQNNEFSPVYEEFDRMRIKLKDSVEEIKNAENLRRDAIISITHDLKTPITSIIGYGEGLLTGIVNTEEKRKKYLTTIIDKAKIVDTLVNDLYNFSKLDLEIEKFNMDSVHTAEVFYDVVEELFILNKNFELKNLIDKHFKTHVKVDIFQLKRVFQNIVQNSVQYSNAENLEITFKLRKSDDGIIISVADNGVGLSEEECKKIFERFYQVDESRNNSSSGIGLNTSKKIIEEMKGNIWARPNKGGGLCINISFKEELS